MVIWTIKLLSTVRRAVAGRKYPHQLAWAVAFGLLLGIVPHGNLLALGLLIMVLSLKLNHAMAGLTAVGASFAATILDPYSHQLGQAVLADPQVADVAAQAWQLPLVPWTDLNNTVVMGSFVIGVVALIPVFLLTYPFFRLLAPSAEQSQKEDDEQAAAVEKTDRTTHEIVVVDQGHRQVAKPHRTAQPVANLGDTPSGDDSLDPTASDELERSLEETVEFGNDVAVETRIDVIRMKDYRDGSSTESPVDCDGEPSDEQQPMDEALNYLLRQLRDSQQRKVA